jgi:hypothetical protein
MPYVFANVSARAEVKPLPLSLTTEIDRGNPKRLMTLLNSASQIVFASRLSVAISSGHWLRVDDY